MIGLCTAHHETSYHLPEGDVHGLLDEDDAVKVVGHQLAAQELDLALTGGVGAQGLLRGELALDGRDSLPAAQDLTAQLTWADMGAGWAITAQLPQERAASFGTEGDQVNASARVVAILTTSMGERK